MAYELALESEIQRYDRAFPDVVSNNSSPLVVVELELVVVAYSASQATQRTWTNRLSRILSAGIVKATGFDEFTARKLKEEYLTHWTKPQWVPQLLPIGVLKPGSCFKSEIEFTFGTVSLNRRICKTRKSSLRTI